MSSSALPAIAYLGVGLMGEAMVLKLLEDGFPVTVWNRTTDKCSNVEKAGASVAASPAEAASAADIVLVCVYDGAAVEDCVFGPEGVVEAASPEKVLVDHSTIKPGDTVRLAERLHEDTGMAWIDAPVSGGPEGARTGNLVILAGGRAEDLVRAQTPMDCLAANMTHMGPLGSGQAAKMVNQLLVGVGFQLIAEAVRFAETTDLDLEKIPACLAGGRGDSGQLQACFNRVVRRDFDPPTGKAGQMLKDMDALLDHARMEGLQLPVTELASKILADYVAAGNGEKETASVFWMLENKSN